MKRFLTVLLSLFLGATALAIAACADNAANVNTPRTAMNRLLPKNRIRLRGREKAILPIPPKPRCSRYTGYGQQYFDRLFFGYGQYGETGELHT